MWMKVLIEDKQIRVAVDNNVYIIKEEEPHLFIICFVNANSKSLTYLTFTHTAYDALLWINGEESERAKKQMEQADLMARRAMNNG